MRKAWDQYFMDIAKQVSTRATCLRKQVGAVIVRDRTILSTGYNGSVKGMAHCTDVGCMMEDGHCVRTVHAEANAIIQAAKNGVNVSGATIYTTASPCWWCFKLIVNSGIEKIVFGELYRDNRIKKFASEAQVVLVHAKEGEGGQGRPHQETAGGLHPKGEKAVRVRRVNRDRRERKNQRRL
jgi:dCMP deaminase